MQICQPRFEKTASFQQPMDTWLAHYLITMDDDTPTIAIHKSYSLD